MDKTGTFAIQKRFILSITKFYFFYNFDCLDRTSLALEKLMEGRRCEIINLDEDDVLQVYGLGGTKVKDFNLMGVLLRPGIFIMPGTTM